MFIECCVGFRVVVDYTVSFRGTDIEHAVHWEKMQLRAACPTIVTRGVIHCSRTYTNSLQWTKSVTN